MLLLLILGNLGISRTTFQEKVCSLTSWINHPLNFQLIHWSFFIEKEFITSRKLISTRVVENKATLRWILNDKFLYITECRGHLQIAKIASVKSSNAKGLPSPFIFLDSVLGKIFGDFGRKPEIISKNFNLKLSLGIQISYKFKFN